jgi:hypothetical protein
VNILNLKQTVYIRLLGASLGRFCIIDIAHIKSNPITGLTSPEVYWRLRLPEFLVKSVHEGGKVISPT